MVCADLLPGREGGSEGGVRDKNQSVSPKKKKQSPPGEGDGQSLSDGTVRAKSWGEPRGAAVAPGPLPTLIEVGPTKQRFSPKMLKFDVLPLLEDQRLQSAEMKTLERQKGDDKRREG